MRANFVATAAIAGCCLSLLVQATHNFKRRSDLSSFPPVSQSGYVVPLQGGETCTSAGSCKSMLPAPQASTILVYLTLARGISTFSCIGRKPTDVPNFLTQDITLWDAAPLLPQLPNEDYFHSIVPKLREFDYTLLKNSSLTCIGTIKSIQAESDVDIFGVTAFRMHTQNQVNAPVDAENNLQWARSTSLDLTWDVYRVETVDGAPPATCQRQNDIINLDYAAEYWFYHG